MPVVTRYHKIIGATLNDDTSVSYTLKEVADFQGNPLNSPTAAFESFSTQPGAAELPRGTIIKVVTTNTRAFTINPTS